MTHIKLTTIKRQLQSRMHYDDPDEAMEVLLYGFGKWLERNKAGTRARITEAKKRGWMTEKQADMFTEYCIPGWRIV